MFLLDTNVVSELRKAGDGRADANVIAWLSNVDAASLYLSSITVMELELGIMRLETARPQSRGPSCATGRPSPRFCPSFSSALLPIDTLVARRSASLHVPDPRPDRDAYIAATAMVHGMTIVTRNLPDFEPTGVAVLNPWSI